VDAKLRGEWVSVKLRIAWSVVCGIACVVLILSWVRSYRHGHLEGYLPAPSHICCRSINGFVVAMTLPAQTVTTSYIDFSFSSGDTKPLDIGTTNTWSGFIFDWHASDFWWLQVPYWFLVTIPALCAALPWLRQRKRFSLRTLLFATTVVAVVLGFAVYAMRQ
jgi:hypothetical protein